jgi:phage/conjugal plasmid C-4 type zinc finger TraR family protein
MTKNKLEAFRQHLLDLRNRLQGDVSHLTGEALRKDERGAGGSQSNMPIHMADVGSDAFEQENTLNLLANQEQALEEITAALDRINDGSFGQCEECGEEIPKARLEVIPYARYCVACARKMERGQEPND